MPNWGKVKMFEKFYRRNEERADGLVWFTIIPVVGVDGVGMRQIARASDDITGTVSKAIPSITQSGTPAHRFANASQCPPKTDLIFWPSGRAVPSIPPGISVRVVGMSRSRPVARIGSRRATREKVAASAP
jgi:hypothetical protein